jgi:hypothetical protein
VQVNPRIHELLGNGNRPEVSLEAAFEAELDEQWSFVGGKANQRWLWYAVDHAIYALWVPTQFWLMCLANGRTTCSSNSRRCLNLLALPDIIYTLWVHRRLGRL